MLYRNSMEKDIKRHYDNLVIGFGKGGKSLAAWLAKRGEETGEEIITGASVEKIEDINTEQVWLLYKNKEGHEKLLEASAI